jgi:hypothetical protein
MSKANKNPLRSPASSLATGAPVNEVSLGRSTVSSRTSAEPTSTSAPMTSSVAGGAAEMTPRLSYQQLFLFHQIQQQQYQRAQMLQQFNCWQPYGPSAFHPAALSASFMPANLVAIQNYASNVNAPAALTPIGPKPNGNTAISSVKLENQSSHGNDVSAAAFPPTAAEPNVNVPVSHVPSGSPRVQDAASVLTQLGRSLSLPRSLPGTEMPNQVASSVPQGQDIQEAPEHVNKEPHFEPPQEEVDVAKIPSSLEDQLIRLMPQDPVQGPLSERPELRTRLIHGSKHQEQARTLEIWKGDITNPAEPVDILVISACRDFDIYTCPNSVIESVGRHFVADIAANHCEFDLRDRIGVWISKPLENLPFRRILCVLIGAKKEKQPYLQSTICLIDQEYHPLSIIYERLFSSIAFMEGKAEDLNKGNISVSIPMVGEFFCDTSVVADHMVRASKRALEGECSLVGKILLYGYTADAAEELKRAAIDSISSWSQHDTPPTPSIRTGAMQMKDGTFCLNDSEADVILGENDTHGITNAITKFYKEDVRSIFGRRPPASVAQVQQLFDLVYQIKNRGRKLKPHLCFWVSSETASKCEARAQEKGETPTHHAKPQAVVFGTKFAPKNSQKQVLFVQACPTCIRHDIKGNQVAKYRSRGNKKRSDSDPESLSVSSGPTSHEESHAPNPQGDGCERKNNRKRCAPDSDDDPTIPKTKRQKGPEPSSRWSSAFGWLTSLVRAKDAELEL